MSLWLLMKLSSQMVNGYVHFIHPRKTVILDSVQVNDGQWHDLKTQWMTGQRFKITLDHGQAQVRVTPSSDHPTQWVLIMSKPLWFQIEDRLGDWVTGQHVGTVFVGGMKQIIGSNTVVVNGLRGCVKVSCTGVCLPSWPFDPNLNCLLL